jgi:chromate transporter
MAQQLATYIGWLMQSHLGRHRGGRAVRAALAGHPHRAQLGLPPFLRQRGLGGGFVHGIKACRGCHRVLQAVWRIGSRTLRRRARCRCSGSIALASFLPSPGCTSPSRWWCWPRQSPAFRGRLVPAQFETGGGHGAAQKSWGPALIDDHTATPPHALFSPRGWRWSAGVRVILWLVPMALLVGAQGLQGTLTQMGWFFTKAALLTFGGAYAVLPYVYQGAVEQFQWLTGAQMIDGLALGETTPGPLIMVVAFVGFVGGFTRQVLGPDALFLGGALAATVATWFTFLPSFLFILAGGPLMESTHGQLRFTAPLTAITAAVVGVIASLALFFLAHIARDRPTPGWPVDLLSLAIAAGAAVALMRFKAGVIPVIAGCALLGMALRLTGIG